MLILLDVLIFFGYVAMWIAGATAVKAAFYPERFFVMDLKLPPVKTTPPMPIMGYQPKVIRKEKPENLSTPWKDRLYFMSLKVLYWLLVPVMTAKAFIKAIFRVA